jgi:hypothetical protein
MDTLILRIVFRKILMVDHFLGKKIDIMIEYREVLKYYSSSPLIHAPPLTLILSHAAC